MTQAASVRQYICLGVSNLIVTDPSLYFQLPSPSPSLSHHIRLPYRLYPGARK